MDEGRLGGFAVKSMASEETKSNLMPLGDHLEELRVRVIHALIGLVPIVVLSLVFGKQLLSYLLVPLQEALEQAGSGSSPQATGPLETFGAYVKISMIAAVLVGSPWLMYQLWRFVSPGLYAKEKRFVYLLLPLSTLLTVGGVVFLYKFVMPALLAFLLSFGSDVGVRHVDPAPLPEGIVLPQMVVLDADPVAPQVGMQWVNKTLHEMRVCIEVVDGVPVIYGMSMHKSAGIRQDYRVAEYVSMVLSLLLAFAVSFQTPVVVLLLGWIGIISTSMLVKYRKYALFATAVVAALATPGDVASMFMLWVPMYILYEFGLLLLWLLPAWRVAGQRKEGPDAAA